MRPTRVIAGIGNSGSGKTTLLRLLSQILNAVYICVDDIRDSLDSAISQEVNEEAWKIAYQKLADAIANESEYVIFDSTLAYYVDRMDFIEKCRRMGVSVTGIFFDTPVEICIARQKARERQVKESAIRDMDLVLSHDKPSIDDGFAHFYHLVPKA